MVVAEAESMFQPANGPLVAPVYAGPTTPTCTHTHTHTQETTHRISLQHLARGRNALRLSSGHVCLVVSHGCLVLRERQQACLRAHEQVGVQRGWCGVAWTGGLDGRRGGVVKVQHAKSAAIRGGDR